MATHDMTDNAKPAEAGNGAEAKTYTPEETQAYIKKITDENKQKRIEAEALAAKLLQVQREQEERVAAQLKEQGDYRKLYEKEAADRAKAAAELERITPFQAAFQLSLEKRIEIIPEGMKTLVPKGLDPLALSEWLDTNAALLTNRRAPNLDPGAGASIGGGTPAQAPTAEDAAMAANFRIPVSEYMKYKAESKASRGSATTDFDLKKMGDL